MSLADPGQVSGVRWREGYAETERWVEFRCGRNFYVFAALRLDGCWVLFSLMIGIPNAGVKCSGVSLSSSWSCVAGCSRHGDTLSRCQRNLIWRSQSLKFESLHVSLISSSENRHSWWVFDLVYSFWNASGKSYFGTPDSVRMRCLQCTLIAAFVLRT